ncbi:hypothetical protein [Marinifilum caeruleilacunae]|uniref:Uncharacterized protein n=1 Tax=Marinifilum caeruleilacunae TaxID=2499076 RepID=A0ABX1WXX5_9BACT|nr:hypothetical protein [Marinifilum caeruleilacunae]NOU60710.1 hypothetical protein [Marinifilum caeruleilacunae]
MKNLILILTIAFSFAACSKMGPKIGPDYNKVKPELAMDKKQEKQFDQITGKYTELRMEAFAKARSGGKMNREAMMAEMKKLFAKQGEELKPVLSDQQFKYFTEWLQKQIPGPVGWSKELRAKIKTELAFDDEKSKMLEAVNQAFVEAYVGAHDNYHGNNEAAKEYWTEFNNNRNDAMKQLLNNEEYSKFLELTKEVRFKGEHGKEE